MNQMHIKCTSQTCAEMVLMKNTVRLSRTAGISDIEVHVTTLTFMMFMGSFFSLLFVCDIWHLLLCDGSDTSSKGKWVWAQYWEMPSLFLCRHWNVFLYLQWALIKLFLNGNYAPTVYKVSLQAAVCNCHASSQTFVSLRPGSVWSKTLSGDLFCGC